MQPAGGDASVWRVRERVSVLATSCRCVEGQEELNALRQARAEANRASPTPTLIVVPEPVLVAPVAADGTLEPLAGPTEAPHEFVSGSLEAMLCQLPWPCWEAVSVAACESGRNLDGFLDGALATNYWTGTPQEGDGVFGLMQIALPLHQGILDVYGGDWRDPWANAQTAYQLWLGKGGTWTHWAWQCRP